jgi:ketosteroid isomerase-like protein
METTTVLREDPRTAERNPARAPERGVERAKANTPPSAAADVERTVHAILDDIARRGSAFDVEGLLTHYADEIATFDLPPPLVLHGKHALRESWQRDVVEMFQPPVSYRYEDVHVHASGDLAVTRSLMRFHGKTNDGHDMNVTLRCTHVLEKRGGAWLIVHEHVSAPVGYDGKGLMELEP